MTDIVSCNSKAVNPLIEAGTITMLDMNDNFGMPVLAVAVTNGCEPIAITMINAGADTTITNPENNNTLLHEATFRNMLAVASVLLEKDADPLAQNMNGETPLHLNPCDPNLVALLYNTNKAIITVADQNSNLPVHTAISCFHAEKSMEILAGNRSTGSLLNKQNNQGETPLHLLARNIHWGFAQSTPVIIMQAQEKLFKAMLTAGADSNFKSKNGVTPLGYLAYGETARLVKVITLQNMANQKP